jgi:hypothetical protein
MIGGIGRNCSVSRKDLMIFSDSAPNATDYPQRNHSLISAAA